jgi:hypothetical protein
VQAQVFFAASSSSFVGAALHAVMAIAIDAVAQRTRREGGRRESSNQHSTGRAALLEASGIRIGQHLDGLPVRSSA